MKAVVPFLPRNIKLHSHCSGSEHVNPNFCCTYIPPDNLGSPNERTCCDHWDNEIPINLCINTPLDNQDRANRLDSDNMECTSDFQSDTSKYDNINTMWTYIPPVTIDGEEPPPALPHRHVCANTICMGDRKLRNKAF